MRRVPIIAVWLMTAGCTFSLDRTLVAGQISGTAVFATSTGGQQPAAGAHVALENSTLSATADSQGHFSIQGLLAGTYALTITASAAGGAFDSGLRLQDIVLPAVASSEDGVDLGTVTIGAFGGMTGSVTLGGAPAVGAAVVLTGLTQATVTAQGYSFQNLAPGTYDLVVYAPGAGSAIVVSQPGIVVAPRQKTPVPAISLDAASAASVGSVTGFALAGMATSSVQIEPTAPGVPATETTMLTVGTQNSQGLYLEASLPTGIYTITAQASGFEPVSVPFVVIGGQTAQVPTITLSRLAQLPDGGTESDSALAAQTCTWLSGCGALSPFPSVGQCESTYDDTLTQLQAASGCSASAAALIAVMDCLTASSCETLDVAGACGVEQAQFQAAAEADSSCSTIAGDLLPPAMDAGTDAGMLDAGVDAGIVDAGVLDAGVIDAGIIDAGIIDAGVIDAGTIDAGVVDAGVIDAGPDLNYVQWLLPSDAPLESDYAVSVDGTTATDSVTGLMWQRPLVSAPCGGGLCDWTSAQSYCESLNTVGLGGYTTGWRLPTAVELVSLLNYGLPTVPLIDTSIFPKTPAMLMWSSTSASAIAGANAWAVDFSAGSMETEPVTSEYQAQCVRSPDLDGGVPLATCGLEGGDCCYGNACGSALTCSDGACVVDNSFVHWTIPSDTPLEAQYTVSADGTTVMDGVTGFVWQRALPASPCPVDGGSGACDWASAQAYCASLNAMVLGGYGSGWRLPSVIELMSLLSYTAPSGALIDTVPFSATPQAALWSSTPESTGTGEAWAVDFSAGTMKTASITTEYAVQCVDAPSPPRLTVSCGMPGEACCYASACGPDYACISDVCVKDVQYEQWAPPADAPQVSAYSNVTEGAVTDTATGLVWASQTSSECGQGTCNWTDASTFCESLDASLVGGLSSGWRLPSEVELMSIVDFGQTGSTLADPTAFPNIAPVNYWSSTVSVPQGSSNWIVNFGTGSPNNAGTASLVAVLCVNSN